MHSTQTWCLGADKKRLLFGLWLEDQLKPPKVDNLVCFGVPAMTMVRNVGVKPVLVGVTPEPLAMRHSPPMVVTFGKIYLHVLCRTNLDKIASPEFPPGHWL